MMAILVTVGTSLPFDGLIQVVDVLIKYHMITDDVYGQIGNGEYIPKYFKQYRRFVGNMDEAYDRVDLVITACGAGTIMEVAKRGIPMIAVSNPDITGGHEWELVEKMESLGHLVFCRNYLDLSLYLYVRNMEFEPFVPDKFNLSLITDILEEYK